MALEEQAVQGLLDGLMARPSAVSRLPGAVTSRAVQRDHSCLRHPGHRRLPQPGREPEHATLRGGDPLWIDRGTQCPPALDSHRTPGRSSTGREPELGP